jgi:DNA-binding NarL/FixJ family response regulator
MDAYTNGQGGFIVNVLIADDQTLFRDMMRSLLEKEPDIQLVGCVGNGAEAIAVCAARPVDVVLMDIRMPEMDGITAAKALCEAAPSARVILLTAFEDRDLSRLAGLANLRGILLKDIHASDLVQAIRLCSHDYYLSDRNCLAALASAAGGTAVDQPGSEMPDETAFSSLDLQILTCLTKGMSNREIAEHVNYSEGTVKSHISRLLAEIGLKDRIQLALFALKHHLRDS